MKTWSDEYKNRDEVVRDYQKDFSTILKRIEGYEFDHTLDIKNEIESLKTQLKELEEEQAEAKKSVQLLMEYGMVDILQLNRRGSFYQDLNNKKYSKQLAKVKNIIGLPDYINAFKKESFLFVTISNTSFKLEIFKDEIERITYYDSPTDKELEILSNNSRYLR
jgi:hypothetical protein